MAKRTMTFEQLIRRVKRTGLKTEKIEKYYRALRYYEKSSSEEGLTLMIFFKDRLSQMLFGLYLFDVINDEEWHDLDELIWMD